MPKTIISKKPNPAVLQKKEQLKKEAFHKTVHQLCALHTLDMLMFLQSCWDNSYKQRMRWISKALRMTRDWKSGSGVQDILLVRNDSQKGTEVCDEPQRSLGHQTRCQAAPVAKGLMPDHSGQQRSLVAEWTAEHLWPIQDVHCRTGFSSPWPESRWDVRNSQERTFEVLHMQRETSDPVTVPSTTAGWDRAVSDLCKARHWAELLC